MSIHFIKPDTRKTITQSIFKTKVLLLDFDNTLVEYPLTNMKALYQLFINYNLKKNQIEKAIKDYIRINDMMWNQYEKGVTTVSELRIERFTQLQKLHPIKGNPKEIDLEYRDYFIGQTTISDEVIQSLNELKALGLKIIIVSNGFKDTQVLRIKNIGLDKIIDGLVTSEQVGKAKPDPLMFKIALQMVNQNKDNAMMVGDSLKSDIAASNYFEIVSCLISETKTDFSIGENPRPNLIANSFTEFSNFFISTKLNHFSI